MARIALGSVSHLEWKIVLAEASVILFCFPKLFAVSTLASHHPETWTNYNRDENMSDTQTDRQIGNNRQTNEETDKSDKQEIFAGYDLAPKDVQICPPSLPQHFACDAPTEDTEVSCDWNSEGKREGGSNPVIKFGKEKGKDK